MNSKENGNEYMGTFGRRKGREKCNSIILSKIKISIQCYTDKF